MELIKLSPSSRRAWIEMLLPPYCCFRKKVALLAEGVDRNYYDSTTYMMSVGRPPRGGRG